MRDAIAPGLVDAAISGGRQAFIPGGTTDEEGGEGERTDGRNLIDEATEAGVQYAWNTETALTLDGTTPVPRLMEVSQMK